MTEEKFRKFDRLNFQFNMEFEIQKDLEKTQESSNWHQCCTSNQWCLLIEHSIIIIQMQ